MKWLAAVFLLLAILHLCSGAANYGNNCAKSSETRAKNDCDSHTYLTMVDKKLSRAGNIPEGSKVCMKHRDMIRKDDKRCSFPSTSGQHTLCLVDLPERLYTPVDNLGYSYGEDYSPGTTWCTSCRKSGETILQESQHYIPPSTRKVTNVAVELHAKYFKLNDPLLIYR